MKVVRIEWIDSEHYGDSWTDRAKAEKWARGEPLPHIISVGQVLYQCAEHVVIVQGAYEGSVDAAVKIPQFAIQSMTELAPAVTGVPEDWASGVKEGENGPAAANNGQGLGVTVSTGGGDERA